MHISPVDLQAEFVFCEAFVPLLEVIDIIQKFLFICCFREVNDVWSECYLVSGTVRVDISHRQS